MVTGGLLRDHNQHQLRRNQMCKECGCKLSNPKAPGFGKGPKKAAGAMKKKGAAAKKK
jgi:hypothetical protein